MTRAFDGAAHERAQHTDHPGEAAPDDGSAHNFPIGLEPDALCRTCGERADAVTGPCAGGVSGELAERARAVGLERDAIGWWRLHGSPAATVWHPTPWATAPDTWAWTEGFSAEGHYALTEPAALLSAVEWLEGREREKHRADTLALGYDYDRAEAACLATIDRKGHHANCLWRDPADPKNSAAAMGGWYCVDACPIGGSPPSAAPAPTAEPEAPQPEGEPQPSGERAGGAGAEPENPLSLDTPEVRAARKPGSIVIERDGDGFNVWGPYGFCTGGAPPERALVMVRANLAKLAGREVTDPRDARIADAERERDANGRRVIDLVRDLAEARARIAELAARPYWPGQTCPECDETTHRAAAKLEAAERTRNAAEAEATRLGREVLKLRKRIVLAGVALLGGGE